MHFMALMESLDIPLGSPIHHFTLTDPSGKLYDSRGLLGTTGLLVAFTCNHCPYAIAVWPRLIRLAVDARLLGIETVAINPNIHPGYPDDAPEKMKDKIAEWNIPFPYLVDETQSIAHAFQAQCTPDLFLFDAAGRLVYHGRIDNNWKDEAGVTRHELRDAVKQLAAGQPIEQRQYPSMGCSIKWRSS
jgi:peroxiredoxin